MDKEIRRVRELEERVRKEDEATERLRKDLDSLQVLTAPRCVFMDCLNSSHVRLCFLSVNNYMRK